MDRFLRKVYINVALDMVRLFETAFDRNAMYIQSMLKFSNLCSDWLMIFAEDFETHLEATLQRFEQEKKGLTSPALNEKEC